jgi:hypothetical protein
MTAIFASVALAAMMFQAPAQRVQVQAGTTVRPETTTVGQHFIATIRVRVPDGSAVRFAPRPDSAAQVDSAGPVARTDVAGNGFTESTVSYVLAAWDTGAQRLGLDSVTIVTPSGIRTIALDGFRVYVRSVLPADTALRKPKPFRPAIAVAPFNWLPWLIAAAAAALAAMLIYAWCRWRRRLARGLTPFQIAERDFARIESQRLIDSGETERYAVEMVGVLRAYRASVLPEAVRSATTRELEAALARISTVPLQRLVSLLDATDLIKFARDRATAERALAAGAEARRIVAGTNAALAAAAAVAAMAGTEAAAA